MSLMDDVNQAGKLGEQDAARFLEAEPRFNKQMRKALEDVFAERRLRYALDQHEKTVIVDVNYPSEPTLRIRFEFAPDIERNAVERIFRETGGAEENLNGPHPADAE